MPLPVRTDNFLGWAFLTGAINEVKPAASFLTNLFFPQRRTVPTETIEMSYIDGDRKLAPFVMVNGEAVSVAGRTHRFANVMAPNIRIKRPMEAYEFLLRRQPGTQVFVTGNDVLSSYRQALADDVSIMADLISNRIEWMCSEMAVKAKLSFAVSEQDNFQVTIPRAAALGGNTGVALTGNNRWGHTFSGATFTEGTTSDPVYDFGQAKYELSKYGVVPTIAVMGRRAAQAFMSHSKVRELMDYARLTAGTLTYQNQFIEQGAIPYGVFAGIQVWEYSRTYVNDAGSEVPFLGEDMVIFLSADAQANNVLYFGAIPDHDAIEGGLLQTEIFSKSWMEKDPSIRVQLAHTRPLPVPRRPNTVYVLDATDA